MKIEIYQINHQRDVNNVCFVRHKSLLNFQGTQDIDSTIYDKVFDGEVECKSLKDVYRMFNFLNPLGGYLGRSLSVSDVVKVCDSNEVEQGYYFCDSFDFKKVNFGIINVRDKEKMEIRNMNVEKIKSEYPVGTKIELINMEGENRMFSGMKGEVTGVDDIGQIHMKWENGSSLALNMEVDKFKKVDATEKISALLVQPSKYPKMILIEDNLEAMQKIVGGDIEEYMPFDDDVAIICNEEGKINGKPFNRAIYDNDNEIIDIISGDFFVVFAPIESEKFLSLPREMADKYYQKFKYPERFTRTADGIIAVPYKPICSEIER